MKKIVLSLALIVAVAAVAGMATMAGWSDTDTSNNNEITAGSMELEWALDMDNDGVADGDWEEEVDDLAGMPFVVTGAAPGETGSATVLVRNAGNTVDGIFTVEGVTYTERGNGSGSADLDQFIDITLQMNSTGRTEELAHFQTTPGSWDFGGGITLSSDGTPQALTASWEFVDKAIGEDGTTSINDTMGDTVLIDFSGVLTQN